MIKPKATNFLLTGILRNGTVNKKTSMPFENVESYDTYIDQYQLGYDGDNVVFSGNLIVFCDTPFKKNVTNFVKGVFISIQLKSMKERNVLNLQERSFLPIAFVFQ